MIPILHGIRFTVFGNYDSHSLRYQIHSFREKNSRLVATYYKSYMLVSWVQLKLKRCIKQIIRRRTETKFLTVESIKKCSIEVLPYDIFPSI